MGVTRIRYLLWQWQQSSAILSGDSQNELKSEKDPEPARESPEPAPKAPTPEKK